MATISENYLSRPFTLAKMAGRELIYDVGGTEDESDVQSIVLGTAPAVYQGLELESIQCEPVGKGWWRAHVRYVRINDNEYTFDTGGGTRHVTQSLATIASYAPPGYTAPDFEGAIGVTDDSVEGVDVPEPKYDFSETHYLPDSTVTDAYKLALANLTGKVNDATFRGFAAGEVLFLGANGSKRGDEKWAITFRFSRLPNVTGLSVGTITGISKKGWEYLWIRYGTFADGTAKALVQRPVAVYVEKVLYDGDFSVLGI